MAEFVTVDRKTACLLPPSVEDWVSADHLKRFIVEVIDQLDLSELTRQYAGRGSKAHHPATLLAILVYGYATGILTLLCRGVQSVVVCGLCLLYTVLIQRQGFQDDERQLRTALGCRLGARFGIHMPQ